MSDFNEIPQEKFDKFQKSMDKSLTQTEVKTMKINYIDIQDFKNIEAISTELYDWNIIWWFNANWKSSLVEAILTGVQWQKFFWNWAVPPASLVKKWEDKAVIRMSIKWEEQELILERVFKSWTTKKPLWDTSIKATINWQKISQKTLDNLLNSLTIDPLKLWTLNIKEQIEEVKATTWLDTTEIDEKINSQEEATKEARSFKKQSDTIYDNCIAWWVPEEIEEASIWDLVKDRQLLQNKASKMDEYSRKKAEIEDLEKKLEEAKKELSNIVEEWKQLHDSIKAKWLTTIEDIDKKIEDIEEHNNKFQKYKDYLKNKEQKLQNDKDLDKEVKKLEKLRKEKRDIISKSKMPDYMTLDEENGIMVDWTPYKLLNTARKIEVAIDLVMISGSPLRMIRIENGWELDTRTLEKVKQKILDNNFQIFIERPTNS